MHAPYTSLGFNEIMLLQAQQQAKLFRQMICARVRGPRHALMVYPWHQVLRAVWHSCCVIRMDIIWRYVSSAGFLRRCLIRLNSFRCI